METQRPGYNFRPYEVPFNDSRIGKCYRDRGSWRNVNYRRAPRHWQVFGASSDAGRRDRELLVSLSDYGPSHNTDYLLGHPLVAGVRTSEFPDINVTTFATVGYLAVLGFLGSGFAYLALSFVSDFGPTGLPDAADWVVVWFLTTIVDCISKLGLLYSRKYRGRGDSISTLVHRLVIIVDVCWFMYGSKVLWLDNFSHPVVDETLVQAVEDPGDAGKPKGKAVDSSDKLNPAVLALAKCLWIYQALRIIIPCAFYSIGCFCCPCIVYAVNRRSSTPPEDKPASRIPIQSLDTLTYAALLKRLADGDSGRRDSTLFHFGPLRIADCRTNAEIPKADERQESDNEDIEMKERPPSVDKASWNSTNTSCPICMLDFYESEAVTVMPCDTRHFFHKECAQEWLRDSKVCPMCRADITTSLALRKRLSEV